MIDMWLTRGNNTNFDLNTFTIKITKYNYYNVRGN